MSIVPNGLLRSGIIIRLQSQVSSDPFLMISQGQLCDPFTHATTLAYYSRKNEKKRKIPPINQVQMILHNFKHGGKHFRLL